MRELGRWIKKMRAKKQKEYDQPWRGGQTFLASTGGTGASVSSTVPWSNSITMPAFGAIDNMDQVQLREVSDKKVDASDVRIEKKPVDVVNEIVAPKPVINTDKIKEQIRIVELRLKVLKQYHGNTSDEIEALKYLRARQYFKKRESMFPWAITTDALIEALVKKYKLQNVSFSSYSKSVPHEATDELEKFAKAWDKVVDDDENHKPTVRLITDYQGPEHKKDPILLASSPFGKWWYILGAWDKEVEIVDEIIYRGK